MEIDTMSALLLSLLLAAPDEVLFRNGDRLSGKVRSSDPSRLLLETPHSGVVAVDWKQVASVRTDGPVRVLLAGGEVVEGRLAPCAEGRVHVVDGDFQREIEKEDVARLSPLPAAWRGLVNVSARSSDGNTDVASLLVSVEAARESAADATLIRGVARHGERSGELQERNAYGLLKHQAYLHPEAYVYGSFEASSDRFKDLRAGLVGSVGTGYDLVRAGWTELSADAGLSYVENRFLEGEDGGHVGARVGGRLRLVLPHGVEARNLFVSYPNFKDPGDWQIRNEATLGTSLGRGWSLLGGVITEVDHEPAEDRERVDDTYFMGLGLKF